MYYNLQMISRKTHNSLTMIVIIYMYFLNHYEDDSKFWVSRRCDLTMTQREASGHC